MNPTNTPEPKADTQAAQQNTVDHWAVNAWMLKGGFHWETSETLAKGHWVKGMPDDIDLVIEQDVAAMFFDMLEQPHPTTSQDSDSEIRTLVNSVAILKYPDDDLENLVAAIQGYASAKLEEAKQRIVAHQNSSVGLVIADYKKENGLDHIAEVGIYRLALDYALAQLPPQREGEQS